MGGGAEGGDGGLGREERVLRVGFFGRVGVREANCASPACARSPPRVEEGGWVGGWVNL